MKEAWKRLLILSLGLSVIAWVLLLQLSPRYFSEASVLVSPSATYQAPVAGRAKEVSANVDKETILSQIQVIKSRDIIAKAIDNMGLMKNEKFQEMVSSKSSGFLNKIIPFSLSSDYENRSLQVRKEYTIDVITENIQVVSLAQSRVIGIRYYSLDPAEAAKVANSLSDTYIEWQRSDQVLQNQDDTIRLSRLINDLKAEVKKSEAAVGEYRAKKGIYQTTRNDVTLGRQQLTELNSRIIAARERRAESEIRAKLIREMLEKEGEISNASETMRSQLIQRLFEQKTRVKRSLSELNATLLPSHPRIRQLRSELRGINQQIRGEMRRIVSSIENNAKIARAREQSLVKSLNDLKNQSVRTGGDEIQLRALEREARTNRELLNTYLSRYRDAEARKDSAIAPAYASVVSKAHIPNSPYFPKVMPITFLIFVISFLMGISYIILRSVLGNAGALIERRKEGKLEPHPVVYDVDQSNDDLD